jgi:hypothetical protein
VKHAGLDSLFHQKLRPLYNFFVTEIGSAELKNLPE